MRGSWAGTNHLTSHWPLVGRHFDHGVLVVGQAVYGWIPAWTAPEAGSPEGRAQILADTKATFADREDHMSWIAGHRVENSPFWRTGHEVADALSPDPSLPWYSRIAWANLYLIAPNDHKGNPEGALRVTKRVAPHTFGDDAKRGLERRQPGRLAGRPATGSRSYPGCFR